MIEYKKATGTIGQIILDDYTDGTVKTVEVYLQPLATAPAFSFIWSYSLDGNSPTLMSSSYSGGTRKRHIGSVSVGSALELAIHLNDTGTVEFGGPTDFVINPFSGAGLKTVDIVDEDDAHKRAVPYVNVGGVWKPATPYAKNSGKWKITS